MDRRDVIFDALAATGAGLVTFVGICHEIIGATLFTWGPAFFGGALPWHIVGAATIVLGVLVYLGTLRVIRFPVILFSCLSIGSGLLMAAIAAVLHKEFHLFALTAAFGGALTALFHRPRRLV